jgi:hypothetical protein
MTPMIAIAGYRCVVEDYVLSGDSGSACAHLLSLVGTREAVRAIWARLMKYESATLRDERIMTVRMEAHLGGRLLTERLPSGAYHGLLLGQACLQQRVLLARTEAELPERFYRQLLNDLRLPLHPAWQAWLWEHAQAYVRELSTRRIKAYELALDPTAIQEMVRHALVRGELPAIGGDDEARRSG